MSLLVPYNSKIILSRISRFVVLSWPPHLSILLSFDPNKIHELDNDLKANELGVKSLLEIENAYKLLIVFQMFYYLNGKFSLTNGLLIVPDGGVPEGTEKVDFNLLYEMFKDTYSDGIVFIQFLCAFAVFLGTYISRPENVITELFKNLSYENLSGAKNIEFDAVSNLFSEIGFMIKQSILLNREKRKVR